MKKMTGGEDGNKFSKFQSILLGRFGKATFDSWFKDLVLTELTRESVTFETGSQVKSDLISQRYLSSMKQAWCAANGPINKVYLHARPGLSAKMSAHAAKVGALVDDQAKTVARNGAAAVRSRDFFNARGPSSQNGAGQKRAPKLSELATSVDERNTFENFAVDVSNELALAAARQIFAEGSSNDLVYIYGPSGVGKTHLLHAVGNKWRERQTGGGGVYLTYSNLVNGCVDAVMTNSISALQRDILSKDLAIMDDIHLLAGKNRTQEEVLNVIDAFLSTGRQLVIAGELAPTKLADSGIHPRLADRLSGGLSVPLIPGGAALRLDILKKRLRAGVQQCFVEDDALEFIARNFPQSMRETIGALNQLLLIYGRREIRVGLEEVRTALKARLQDRKRIVTLSDALSAAAESFSVTIEEMRSRARPQRIVRARHGFVYCGREVLKESFPRIGAVLGRDHTTAMSSMDRAQALLERDKSFQEAVFRMREKLER